MTERQPSARVKHKRKQARQEILQIARCRLREGGVEAVTLASVAGELGMTKQALYHYFPSKEALVRGLVTTLLDDEISALVNAVEASDSAENTLGILIRAFYEHYVERLDAFRIVYCQSQLYPASNLGIDRATLRDEINPRTRQLFNILEQRMASGDINRKERDRMRRLAFTAWTSALGLLTMLGIAEATNDPLIHSDQDLLATLAGIFDAAALRA